MKKLTIAFSINILISLFTSPVYSQYCSTDTTHLTGEVGANGWIIGYLGNVKCTDAIASTDGGIIATDAIILAPNFHVQAGVNFLARVEDCRSTKPYLNMPSENTVMDNGCMDNSDFWSWAFEWNPVEGATEYQLYVKRQGESSPEIDEILTITSITIESNVGIPNSRLDNWEAKVRAKVDGVWTVWYGGEGDQPLAFSVEPISTDCAPVITTPLPQATLDNGCNGVDELFNWNFGWTEVAGATAYQFIVKHPLVNVNTFDRTIFSTSWTYNQPNQVNGHFTGWTVKVRARVDGMWTDYHGSTLAEEVMLFNVEHVNTDCAPQIISPSSDPKVTLDNGCIPSGAADYFDWGFTIVEQPISQENELRVLKPDGSIYTPPNLQIITIQDEGSPEIHYIYRVFNEYVPANDLENWSVQARSKIDGVWTGWFGHLLTPSRTYFDVEAPIACSNFVDNEASSRNQVTNVIAYKSLDLKVYPNPFQHSCTIEYSLGKESEVILEVYTLTGQLVTSLVKGKKESGNHAALFERNPSLTADILIVRLQVDGEIHYRKLVMDN